MINSLTVALLLASAVIMFVKSNGQNHAPRCESVNSTGAKEEKLKSWMCSGSGRTSVCYRRDYYYDEESDTCKFLGFLGCGGNQNRFPSLFECLDHCKTKIVTYKGYENWKKHLPNCSVSFNSSTDSGNILRFTYDSVSKECKPVNVAGAKADLHFPDMRHCVKTCNATVKQLPRCKSQMQTGNHPEGWTCEADIGTRYTSCRMTSE
uniref:BPTI/Kunitz inhibitor domain-containing protein n=1 Tax=Amblyomma triste TaxID=251400 RepID=A0A023G5D9_AMBTT